MAQEKPIHLGDVVYFSYSEAQVPERKIWTSSIEQMPQFQLVPESSVPEITIALFRIDSDQPHEGELKPGETIKLFHILTNTYVYGEVEKLGWDLKFNGSAATPLSLYVAAPRGDLGNTILDGDLVSITTPTSPPYSLCKDFWFMVGHTAAFRLHRYHCHTPNRTSILTGFPFKLHSNHFYLSVQPNSTRSDSFILPKDQRKENYLENEEINYPEYVGELKAELTTDAGNGNNYWVAEYQNRLKGGQIERNQPFFLKHLASGKYLARNLTLNSRSEAVLWSFGSENEAKTGLEAGDTVWVGYEDRLISPKTSSALKSLQTQLFSTTPGSEFLRGCVSSRPVTALKTSLKFTLELPSPLQQYISLCYTQYRDILPKLRLILQNITKIADPGSVLKTLLPTLGLKSLNLATIDMEFAADLASDFQIVTEMFRCWMLAKRMKKKEKFKQLLKELECIETLHSRLQNIFYFDRVIQSLFSRKALLLKMANLLLAPFCDVLQWAVKAHPPKAADRIFWCEIFLTNPLPLNTYPEFICMNFFCHHLLDNLTTPMLFKDLHALKREDHFIVKFEKEGNDFIATSFGKIHTTQELMENLSGFVATTVELAAEVCVLSRFKQEIVTGMGLDMQNSMELFDIFGKNIRLQLSLLYFIAKVHVPNCSNLTTVTELAGSRLLARTAFSESEEESRERDIYFFTAPNAPVARLIPFSIDFWLRTKHESEEDATTWYYNSSVYLRLATKLITHRAVSDMYVGSVLLSSIAVCRYILGEPIPSISDRFPNLSASKFRTETEKQRFIDSTLELIDAYQNWKLVKVIGKLPLSVLSPVTKQQISTSVEFFSLQNIWQRHFDANKSDLEQLFSEKGVLSRTYKLLLELPQLGITQFVDLLKERKFKGHFSLKKITEIREKNEDFGKWVEKYLEELYDETPFQPYRFYLKSIDENVLNTTELSSSQNQQVTGLRGYVQGLETLVDFMAFLKGGNLTSFQLFLEKAGFERMMDRMWMYCDVVSNDEEQQSILLKVLTIELTHLYCQDNPAHQTHVKRLLASHDLFFELPQYTHLLRHLQVLDWETAGYMCMKLVKVIRPMKHFILAAQTLLEDPYCVSGALSHIINWYLTLDAPKLTGPQWEILICFIQSVPPPLRYRLFAPVIAKWYEADPAQIRREGSTILVYSIETRLNVFHHSLQATVAHLTQLNQRPADVLSARLRSFSQDSKPFRERCFDPLENDLNYVLEIIWEAKGGILDLIPLWMPRITLQNIMSELAQLYILLDTDSTPHSNLSKLYNVINTYVWGTDDSQTPENQALFKAVMAKGLPEPTQDNQADAGMRIESMTPLTKVVD